MNEPPKEPVKYIETTIHLPYHYVAGDYRALYMRNFKHKRIIGSQCSKTGKVFLPPQVCSPESGAPCETFVCVSDRGIVTTFCIVNIPVIGRNLEIPYVASSVALDPARGERLADDGVEHLDRRAMLVARDDRHLREAHQGDVAESGAHSRLMNDAIGASGSPVGRKWRMSSWLPCRSPSGFQTASTRMPMRTSAAWHSWMAAKMEMSAPSSATDAATYGSSMSRPITGMQTTQKVVTMPLSEIGRAHV